MKFRKLEVLREDNQYLRKVDVLEKTVERQFKIICQGNEGNSVNCIDFFKDPSELCAIACGTKVMFVDIGNDGAVKTYTGFKNFVRCVTPRKDNRLCAASDDSGKIKVIEIENKRALRCLKGHIGSVRSCCFSEDKVHILSGGDDCTLKYWDISTGDCISTLSEHTDYIRTVKVSNLNIFASGSYDKTIKLWDMRIPCQKSICTVDQGYPVECVNFFPNGLLLLSSCGNEVKIWDAANGMKLISHIGGHLQTVTSAVVNENCDNPIVISSSLDKTIRWNSIMTGETINTLNLKSQVLTLATSTNSFAAGMADGSWFIRKLKSSLSRKGAKIKKANSNSLKYFKRGKYEPAPEEAITIDEFKGIKLNKLDKLLRSFKYQVALDYSLTLPPCYTYGLLEELIQRGGLNIAFRGRTVNNILPILKFFDAQIDKSFVLTNILVEALHSLLNENNWLFNCTNKETYKLLKKIFMKISNELSMTSMVYQVKGFLDLIESI